MSCVLTVVQKNKCYCIIFFHDGRSLLFIYFICALYLKCRDIKVCREVLRHLFVPILSSVHVKYVFSQTGMIWKIGTPSSGLNSLFLHWHGRLLYCTFFFWQRDFILFLGPTNETYMWTAHVDIFYCFCILSNCRKKNKRTSTGTTELSKRHPTTK